jgi:putative restriction endonuclease
LEFDVEDVLDSRGLLMKSTRIWERNELILALDLYCRIPFGKLHSTNPLIVDLAKKIGRSNSAVSMKMCNFASFDPTHQKRNIKGLKHSGKQDKVIWDEFCDHWESLVLESQTIGDQLGFKPVPVFEPEFVAGEMETETVRTLKVRIVQRFFREAVLSSYLYQCSICSLNVPALLNASHIIPWAKDKTQRANPRNGISMCALHDRAFDRGLFTIDDQYEILLSKELKKKKVCEFHQNAFYSFEGKKIVLPERFAPEAKALQYHRECVFVG